MGATKQIYLNAMKLNIEAQILYTEMGNRENRSLTRGNISELKQILAELESGPWPITYLAVFVIPDCLSD
jgi:hypothetical protein